MSRSVLPLDEAGNLGARTGVERGMRRGFAVLVLTLAIAGCGAEPPFGSRGDGGPPAPEPAPLFEVSATVLEDAGHGPMLCLGAMLASLPPQCGDVPIANWDWDDVGGEERNGDTIFGGYHLVGRYDGEEFFVTDTGPHDASSQPEEPAYVHTGSPCHEPASGWETSEQWTQNDVGPANLFAASQPEYVASWVTHLKPDQLEFSPVVLNVVFAENAERHKRELRARWAGPLCVVERAVPTARELRRLRREVEGGLGDQGLEMLWSSGPGVEPVIEIGIVADPGGKAQAALDERYGAGLVRLYPALREVRP
jgi:hypothetical protein